MQPALGPRLLVQHGTTFGRNTVWVILILDYIQGLLAGCLSLLIQTEVGIQYPSWAVWQVMSQRLFLWWLEESMGQFVQQSSPILILVDL